jgi:hypothetical protein
MEQGGGKLKGQIVTLSYLINLILLVVIVGLIVAGVVMLVRAISGRGRTAREIVPLALSSESLTTADVLGPLLVTAGVIGGVFSLMMPTSVDTGIGPVNNIGLMHDQEMYLIVSGFLALIGVIVVVGRRR